MRHIYTLFLIAVLSAALLALSESEKACVEEKRAQLKEAIENCRKNYTDTKDISICAQNAKAQFALAVKQCYEQK